MSVYKFRCEFYKDYENLQNVCGNEMSHVKVFRSYPFPDADCEIEFTSTLSLSELLELFDSVTDAHVASETLMPLYLYTGERHYKRKY
jgi:hypothetical protein